MALRCREIEEVNSSIQTILKTSNNILGKLIQLQEALKKWSDQSNILIETDTQTNFKKIFVNTVDAINTVGNLLKVTDLLIQEIQIKEVDSSINNILNSPNNLLYTLIKLQNALEKWSDQPDIIIKPNIQTDIKKIVKKILNIDIAADISTVGNLLKVTGTLIYIQELQIKEVDSSIQNILNSPNNLLNKLSQLQEALKDWSDQPDILIKKGTQTYIQDYVKRLDIGGDISTVGNLLNVTGLHIQEIQMKKVASSINNILNSPNNLLNKLSQLQEALKKWSAQPDIIIETDTQTNFKKIVKKILNIDIDDDINTVGNLLKVTDLLIHTQKKQIKEVNSSIKNILKSANNLLDTLSQLQEALKKWSAQPDIIIETDTQTNFKKIVKKILNIDIDDDINTVGNLLKVTGLLIQEI